MKEALEGECTAETASHAAAWKPFEQEQPHHLHSCAWLSYLANVLCMHVGQGRHAGSVRTRLVVLLLCQGGVDCGKLALQPLHLQSACHTLKTHRRLTLGIELDSPR